MTKEEIFKELNKGNTYKEVGKIAQNLLYKLCPLKRDDIYEDMFYDLYKDDLEKIGYEVYEVGARDYKKLENNLIQRGYLYTFDVFFSPEKKEIWKVEDYPSRANVCVYNSFLDFKNFVNLPKLISKEQYAELVADKIMKEFDSWEKLKKFFNSLVETEKYFYNEQLEEEKKEKIIEEALEKARKEGLIK